MRAKRGRGYPECWLRLWQCELSVGVELIGRGVSMAAIRPGGELIGFVLAAPFPGTCLLWEVTHFWVRPQMQGAGIGRELFRRILPVCRGRGARQMLTLSDPGAARFYGRLGFVWLGWQPSDTVPGRRLPLMSRRVR